jgi:hypothetical protein
MGWPIASFVVAISKGVDGGLSPTMTMTTGLSVNHFVTW